MGSSLPLHSKPWRGARLRRKRRGWSRHRHGAGHAEPHATPCHLAAVIAGCSMVMGAASSAGAQGPAVGKRLGLGHHMAQAPSTILKREALRLQPAQQQHCWRLMHLTPHCMGLHPWHCQTVKKGFWRLCGVGGSRGAWPQPARPPCPACACIQFWSRPHAGAGPAA